MESTKIKSESVMERASNVKTDSFEMLEKLGPLVLTRLGLMYNRWHDRNSKFQESDKVTFPTWVDNFDRVNAICQENSSLKLKVTNLQNEIDEIKNDILDIKFNKVKEEIQEQNQEDVQDKEEVQDQDQNQEQEQDVQDVQDVLERMENMETLLMQPEDDNVDLKVPKTEEEFNKVRKTIYLFNKKNYKLEKKAKTWGDGYNRIVNKKTLVAWLESPFAEERGLGISILEDFSVCVVDDCLVTLDRDFKGGIGVEAFWIPPSRYDSVAEVSTVWKSDSHKDSDPRHGYLFKGSKWVPELDSDQTSKRARVF